MGYQILIIDDSAVTRAVLKKTIGMTGVEVDEIIEASNGQEALQLLSDGNADLIMADLNMPRMNGMELAERLFNDSTLKHIPMVVISTEASAARIEELQHLGIKGYIHKPFTPEAIRKILVDTLNIEKISL